MFDKPIYVTRPTLPPLDEFIPYLEKIWQNKVLTNGGPFHQKLEEKLCEYLGVEYISLFCNATIALVSALQAQRVTGEVITTPYSFVATSHALLWNGLTPVFVDIDEKTLNIDPRRIEEAITPRTTAILPVHCYGHPCDVDAIEDIAARFNLKVIYDAAHAFGVKCHCGSLLKHGDLSVLSFHATKVFNTFEGGAIVSPNQKTKQQIDRLKNFGFVDETTVAAPGINGKMSEINAAFGLLQLNHIDESIRSREAISTSYRQKLSSVSGIRIIENSTNVRHNFAYFPIFVTEGFRCTRDELYMLLQSHGVYARRYFFPLISQFPMYRGLPTAIPENLPVATEAARRILCLPMSGGLTDQEIDRVVAVIKGEV